MLISFLSFPFFIRKYKEEAVFILAITFGFFSLVGSIGLFDAYSSRLLVPLVPFLLLPLYSLNLKRKEINLGFYFLILLSIVINFAGVDTFLPKVPDPSLILETYGNHNILGEFLLRNSVNLHYLTITPLLIITAFIWNLEIRNFLQNIRRED
jgi:ABC-type enterochelin transport system permease subunit